MKVVYNPADDKVYFSRLASFLFENGIRDEYGEIIEIETYDAFKQWIDKAIELGAPRELRRPMYKIIFDQLNEDNVLSTTVTDLVTYYSHLDEIEDKYGPEFLRLLPVEEDYFYIDLNTRTITKPKALTDNKWIVGVKEDHLAELLWFKVDRFIDGQDLAICFPMENAEKQQGQTYVQWKNSKEQGLDTVRHVQIEEDVIYFAWYLRAHKSSDITNYSTYSSGPLSASGKLTFSILFEYRMSGDAKKPDRSSPVLFSLNTNTVTCDVLSNLTETLPSNTIWEVEDTSDIEYTRPRFSEVFNNTKGAKANISTDLPLVQDLTEQAEDGSLYEDLVIEASPVNSDKPLTYRWYRNAIEIPVVDEEGNSTTSKNTIRVTEPGIYEVFVYNEWAEGKKRKTESNPCVVPGPSEFEIITNTPSQKAKKADGNTQLSVTATVPLNGDFYDPRYDPKGSFVCTWVKRDPNTGVETEVTSTAGPVLTQENNSTTFTYTPAVANNDTADDGVGEYYVKIVNKHNNAISAVLSTENEKIIVKAIPDADIFANVKPELTHDEINNELRVTIPSSQLKHQNDLYYRWYHPNKSGDITRDDYIQGKNTYTPTIPGSYYCAVIQHVEFDDGTVYKVGSEAKNTTGVFTLEQ